MEMMIQQEEREGVLDTPRQLMGALAECTQITERTSEGMLCAAANGREILRPPLLECLKLKWRELAVKNLANKQGLPTGGQFAGSC